MTDRGTHPKIRTDALFDILHKHTYNALYAVISNKQQFIPSIVSSTLCVCAGVKKKSHFSIKDAKMTSKPVCKNNPDQFCYICGEYDSTQVKKRITKAHEKAFLAYFGHGICDQNAQWVPHLICKSCHLGLLKWMNDCGGGLSFSRPMIWREPSNHNIDCYFCLTQIDGNTGNVIYPNVISVTKPVPNNALVNTQVPIYNNNAPVMRSKNREQHLILPNELDLLISGLNLSERSAEILVKTFQQWNILAPCEY